VDGRLVAAVAICRQSRVKELLPALRFAVTSPAPERKRSGCTLARRVRRVTTHIERSPATSTGRGSRPAVGVTGDRQGCGVFLPEAMSVIGPQRTFGLLPPNIVWG
jgi:hypothetical protein